MAMPTKTNVLGVKLRTPEKNTNTPTIPNNDPTRPTNFELLFACAMTLA